MSNFRRHVKSDKIKWIVTAIVILLLSITIVFMGLQLFGKGKTKPSEWFKKADKQVAKQAETDVEKSESKDTVVIDGAKITF